MKYTAVANVGAELPLFKFAAISLNSSVGLSPNALILNNGLSHFDVLGTSIRDTKSFNILGSYTSLLCASLVAKSASQYTTHDGVNNALALQNRIIIYKPFLNNI